MNCPSCGHSLVRANLHGVPVDECEECGGTWFDQDELQLAKDSTDPDLRWLDFDVFGGEEQFEGQGEEQPDEPGGPAPSGRLCPHCGAALAGLEYLHSKVVVERCPARHGVWLERGEFQAIVGYLEKVVATMDVGDYAHTAATEIKDVVTGRGGRRSEIRDLTAVLRLLKLRIAVEHPQVARTIDDLSTRGL